MPAKKKPSARSAKPKSSKSKAKATPKKSKPKTSKAKTSARKPKTAAAAAAPSTEEVAPAPAAEATGPAPEMPGEPAPPPPPPKPRNPLVVPLIIVLVLFLIAAATLGYFLFLRKDDTKTTGASRVVTKPAATATPRAGAADAKGSCEDVTHPEDRVGQLDNGTRHSGSDETVAEATSKPPSSGIHGGGFASNRTIYDTAQPVGNLVHSIDHGSVVIWHKQLPKDEYAALSAAANRNARRGFGALIMVPYDDMDANIALTAWGSLMACDGVDDEAIDDFIDEFMATGPEKQVACAGYMPRGHPRCA